MDVYWSNRTSSHFIAREFRSIDHIIAMTRDVLHVQ